MSSLKPTGDDFSYCELQPSGLTVGYVSRGSGPLVLFLHGFPDTYRGFLPAMDLVASAGYRAVAPEPRGYAPTDIPVDNDYRVEAYASDVLALADALGAECFSIVGHDWGALTAYAAANLAPKRVERLLTAAVPHTGHFLLGMRWRQALRSRYMLYFQVPRLAEWQVRRNDYAYLQRLIGAWAPTWHFDDSTLKPLKDNYNQPMRLTAALSCYRDLPRSIASPLSRRLIFSAVSVPTRILYGVDDGCIGASLFQQQESHFSGPLELVPMRDTGHFIQWERPMEFAEQVLSFLPSLS